MRFRITMNMPSANNNLVHQIICEHSAKSLEAFLDAMCDADFIICTEYYTETNRSTGAQMWTERGEIILNTSAIGKVKAFYDRD